MSAQETAPTPRDPATVGSPRRIPAPVLWFAVLGGVVAWSVQILVTWSVMEVSCVTPLTGDLVDQRGGTPGTVAWTVTIAGMVVPLVVAVLAFVTCLWVQRRLKSYAEGEEPTPDVLSGARTSFLVILGIFLDLMSIAIIAGSAVGLWVLEPCG